MLKKTRYLSIIFIIFLIILAGFWLFEYFSQSESVQSASTDNVTGWIWGGGDDPSAEAGSGWISFNCYNDYNNDGILTNRCTFDYGVHVDSSTGGFSGEAWSGGGQEAGSDAKMLGWISFDRSETGNPPAAPFNTGDPSDSIASLDFQTGQVLGWMKALAADDNGWDGWIKLGDSTGNWSGTDEAQVEVNLTTKRFSGWAWGSDVVGWISFNVFADECDQAAPFGIVDPSAPEGCAPAGTNMPPLPGGPNPPPVDINFPPTVDYDSVTWSCCVDSLNPWLYWTYNDPENETQGGYQIQIKEATEPSWANSIIDITADPSSSDNYHHSGTELNWNTNYEWRVIVRDDGGDGPGGKPGNWSDWTNVSDNPSVSGFTTKLHAYPDVIIDWAPNEPSAGENVSMIDNSDCYDPDGVKRECSTATNDSYKWEFSGPSPVIYDLDYPNMLYSEEPIVSFSEPGTWVVSLSVTDGDLIDCDITPRSYNINVREPLPWWREIIPRL